MIAAPQFEFQPHEPCTSFVRIRFPNAIASLKQNIFQSLYALAAFFLLACSPARAGVGVILNESFHTGIARIIIYGDSWGASECVALSRALERDGIPVLLTIQVDSVTKRGEDDALIPANVAQAINFYQPDGIIHGRPEIRAADSAHTEILGNFRFDYKANPSIARNIPGPPAPSKKLTSKLKATPSCGTRWIP